MASKGNININLSGAPDIVKSLQEIRKAVDEINQALKDFANNLTSLNSLAQNLATTFQQIMTNIPTLGMNQTWQQGGGGGNPGNPPWWNLPPWWNPPNWWNQTQQMPQNQFYSSAPLTVTIQSGANVTFNLSGTANINNNGGGGGGAGGQGGQGATPGGNPFISGHVTTLGGFAKFLYGQGLDWLVPYVHYRGEMQRIGQELPYAIGGTEYSRLTALAGISAGTVGAAFNNFMNPAERAVAMMRAHYETGFTQQRYEMEKEVQEQIIHAREEQRRVQFREQATTLLPAVLGVLGTVLGGPLGGAIGYTAGKGTEAIVDWLLEQQKTQAQAQILEAEMTRKRTEMEIEMQKITMEAALAAVRSRAEAQMQYLQLGPKVFPQELGTMQMIMNNPAIAGAMFAPQLTGVNLPPYTRLYPEASHLNPQQLEALEAADVASIRQTQKTVAEAQRAFQGQVAQNVGSVSSDWQKAVPGLVATPYVQSLITQATMTGYNQYINAFMPPEERRWADFLYQRYMFTGDPSYLKASQAVYAKYLGPEGAAMALQYGKSVAESLPIAAQTLFPVAPQMFMQGSDAVAAWLANLTAYGQGTRGSHAGLEAALLLAFAGTPPTADQLQALGLNEDYLQRYNKHYAQLTYLQQSESAAMYGAQAAETSYTISYERGDYGGMAAASRETLNKLDQVLIQINQLMILLQTVAASWKNTPLYHEIMNNLQAQKEDTMRRRQEEEQRQQWDVPYNISISYATLLAAQARMPVSRAMLMGSPAEFYQTLPMQIAPLQSQIETTTWYLNSPYLPPDKRYEMEAQIEQLKAQIFERMITGIRQYFTASLDVLTHKLSSLIAGSEYQATIGAGGGQSLMQSLFQRFMGLSPILQTQQQFLNWMQSAGYSPDNPYYQQVVETMAQTRAQQAQFGAQMGNVQPELSTRWEMLGLQVMGEVGEQTFSPYVNLRAIYAAQLRNIQEQSAQLDAYARYIQSIPDSQMPKEIKMAALWANRQQRAALVGQALQVQNQLIQGWQGRLISSVINAPRTSSFVASQFSYLEASRYLQGIIPMYGFSGRAGVDARNYWMFNFPALAQSLVGMTGMPEGMVATAMAGGAGHPLSSIPTPTGPLGALTSGLFGRSGGLNVPLVNAQIVQSVPLKVTGEIKIVDPRTRTQTAGQMSATLGSNLQGGTLYAGNPSSLNPPRQ